MMYHRTLIICNNGSHYDILYFYSVFVFWSYQHPHNPSFTPPFWLTFIFPINHTHSKINVIYFSLYHSHTGFELPFKARIDVTCLCSWGPCCDICTGLCGRGFPLVHTDYIQFLGLLHCSAPQGSLIDFLTNWVEWYFTRVLYNLFYC